MQHQPAKRAEFVSPEPALSEVEGRQQWGTCDNY